MPEHLTAAARRRHAITQARAEDALLVLSRAGEPITFAAVARQAKVSTDFLYNQPELREKINALRSQSRHRSVPVTQAGVLAQDPTSAAVRALSSQIKDLKRRHAEAIQELREALAAAHGENLELRRRLARSAGPEPGSCSKSATPPHSPPPGT